MKTVRFVSCVRFVFLSFLFFRFCSIFIVSFLSRLVLFVLYFPVSSPLPVDRLLESIFSYIFGDGDPDVDIERRRLENAAKVSASEWKTTVRVRA